MATLFILWKDLKILWNPESIEWQASSQKNCKHYPNGVQFTHFLIEFPMKLQRNSNEPPSLLRLVSRATMAIVTIETGEDAKRPAAKTIKPLGSSVCNVCLERESEMFTFFSNRIWLANFLKLFIKKKCGSLRKCAWWNGRLSHKMRIPSFWCGIPWLFSKPSGWSGGSLNKQGAVDLDAFEVVNMRKTD